MTEDHTREDPDVARLHERSIGAVIAGAFVAICGGVSAVIGDPANVQAIAGGWGAIWSGVLLASVGGGAAGGHARLMHRKRQNHDELLALQRRHHAEAMAQAERHHAELMAERRRDHEAVMAELAEIHVALAPADQIGQRRHGSG